jgi:hypothetical protein
MAKRFCDTDLWKNQRWFRKLAPNFKLVFCYIRDECNHAGLWKIDCTDLIEDLGIEYFSLDNFVSAVNTEYDPITGEKIIKERLRVVKNNFLWITGFIQYQYEGKGKRVTQTTNCVRSALAFLDGIGILNEALAKGYITLTEPFCKGWLTLKDKDKDKDSISLTENKNHKNGKKFSGNFKAQSEELWVGRLNERLPKSNES